MGLRGVSPILVACSLLLFVETDHADWNKERRKNRESGSQHS